MQLLDLLQQRASHPARLLDEPAPSDEQLHEIVKAGLTAPDHAALTPWRFIIIRGEARVRLGEIFATATAAREPNLSAEKVAGQRSKPLRSPLLLAVVTTVTPEHPKTPVIEQFLSTGAAAQMMQLAANAMGFGSIWLSGPNCFDPNVKAALGIADKDELSGFLYLGTPTADKPPPRRPEVTDHLSEWTGA